MNKPRARSIFLATGGDTGGHINIAIAISKSYKKQHPNYSFHLTIPSVSSHEQLDTVEDIIIHRINSLPYAKQSFFGKLLALIYIPYSTYRSIRILRKHRADLVIGCGGYGSAAPILAAYCLRISTVIYEANVRYGFANKWLSYISDQILLGWESVGSLNKKTMVTGIPLSSEHQTVTSNSSRRTEFDSRRRILIVGGSLGSGELNKMVPALMKRISDRGLQIVITHQTGSDKSHEVIQRYNSQNMIASVVEYIDDMPDTYANNDFAISSAGASSLCELSHYSIPSLIVPLQSSADNHQTDNAIQFCKLTGSRWIYASFLDSKEIADYIMGILSNHSGYQSARKDMRKFQKPLANEKIVKLCEDMLDCAIGDKTF